jgi:hypothetical protein
MQNMHVFGTNKKVSELCVARKLVLINSFYQIKICKFFILGQKIVNFCTLPIVINNNPQMASFIKNIECSIEKFIK